MSKFTPGPWAVETEGNLVAVVDDETLAITICQVYDRSKPEIRAANAKLIAAAPELLEALQGLLADITEYQTINKLGGENNHWQVIARAAIAKATS